VTQGTTQLDVDLITIEGDTQPRAAIHEPTVAEYAEEMQLEHQFPPIVVFFDGKDYWLADGFHRWHGARRAGRPKILASVLRGTRADAQWYAYGANRQHGLRRTDADKRRAVQLTLAHPKAKMLNNSQIALHCGVSEAMVRKYRDEKSPDARGGLRNVRKTAPKSNDSNDPDLDDIPMGD